MNETRLLSVVVPVFNESEVLGASYARLKHALDSLDAISYEIIFVDDGSNDGSYHKLVSIAKLDPCVKLIKLARNFGHQVAMTAGIDVAKGDAVVAIDADLQDPPEMIHQLILKWEEGYDVVYGIRQKRQGEGRIKRFTAFLFYRVLRSLTQIDIPVDTGDFRLMSKRAATYFRQLREKDRYVRGLVSWLGFRQTGVYYTRHERYAGVTKYPFHKMLKFALDGITSFSNVPLRLATWLGYSASFLAFLYGCSVFIQKALGNTVQGWATIMIGILFLGGVQLICIGIVGEYVGRIYNEIKQRPLYIVEEIYGGEKAALKDERSIRESSYTVSTR